MPTYEIFLQEGVIVDTVEIAADWKKIEVIYKNAITALNGVEIILNTSVHSSLCYSSGLNLYSFSWRFFCSNLAVCNNFLMSAS